MKKNIYVKPDSRPLLKRFEDLGGNASELFAWALHQWEKGKVNWGAFLAARTKPRGGYPEPK